MSETQPQEHQPSIPDAQTPEQKLANIGSQIEQFKNDWAALQTVRTSAETVQTEINRLQEQIKSDINAITESKTSFISLKKQAQTHSNTLNSKLESLEAEIQATEKQKATLNNLLAELQQIKTNADQAKGNVEADVQAISKTKVDFENLRNQAQALHNDLQGRQTDAQNKINEIHELHGKVRALHNELLQDKLHPESKEITEKCLNSKIQDLFAEMGKLLIEMKQHRDDSKAAMAELRKELEDEIRMLLPEAGAAGLSSAYVQAKSKYGAIPYEGRSAGLGYLWHIICSHASSVIYYVLFIAPLGGMLLLFVDLFRDLQSSDIDEKVILLRILIAVPLGIISLFGWSSIRLSRRLYEEYNHKQRVMQLYHSFKKEIDSQGNDEHKQALLSIMLRAVDDKPSLAMHKYDKGIEDMWPSLSLSNLLPTFGGKKGGE